MDARSAALGTTAFAAVPATMGGVIPWLVGAAAPGSWERSSPGTVAGWLLVALGVTGLAEAFVRFARDGLGTPFPGAPTEHLVVTGPYRYVRNPMYVAVVAVVVGQALLWRSTAVLAYAVLFVTAVTAFVALYEEPTLRETHGDEYARYAATVPRWLPRPGHVWPRPTTTAPHPGR
ncbi:methyltransferase family protein [Terrabacter terrigena]|uniref:Methyltransferase family protein n=1 Tax=Terrabacter terrigena TaxID=574718 RepID=A0ABW3MSV4_9MICO